MTPVSSFSWVIPYDCTAVIDYYGAINFVFIRIVLSFDLNENINQDEGGADVDAADSDEEEAFMGKVSLVSNELTLLVLVWKL